MAAYDKLTTLTPTFKSYFTDLFTKNNAQQDEQNFNMLFQDGVFDSSFGSSLLWTVQGGTNFWKDLAEKYQVHHSPRLINQESGMELDLLKIEKVSETTTLFRYAFTCESPSNKGMLGKPHRFRVNMRQQNMQSRYLLRPALHELNVDVHCEPPHADKLYWAQSTRDASPNSLRWLPKFKVVSSERIYFVLVGSQHHLRSMFLDNTGQVFLNHSSIQTLIVSSNEEMLQVHSLFENYHDQVLEDVYDKRRVDVKNITGTVFINSLSQYYYKSFISSGGRSYFGSGSSHEQGEGLHVAQPV